MRGCAAMCYIGIYITFDPALFDFAQCLYLYMHWGGMGVQNKVTAAKTVG